MLLEHRNREYMLSRKNRAAANRIPPISAMLNCDDRKKFSTFVELLVQINKRINPEEYAVPARSRSKKKTKECNLENLYKKGSQSSGPCLILIAHALSLLQYFKHLICDKAYDRHRGIIFNARYV